MWFACAQSLLSAAVEFGDPLLRDPEFGNRLQRLQCQLAEKPDARLLLVLGSSLLDGYLPDPAEWRRRWLGLHVAPSYWYRFQLLAYCAPSWLDFESRQDGAFSQIDPLGWSPLTDSRLAETTWADRARQAREHYAPALPDFDISEAPDRALRMLIAEARGRGSEVGLLLMPEGESFRALYTVEARRTIANYLSRLSRECSVPVFDATTWCAENCFADGHHLLPDGSASFSRRLGREVIGPLIARTLAARRPSPSGRPRR